MPSRNNFVVGPVFLFFCFTTIFGPKCIEGFRFLTPYSVPWVAAIQNVDLQNIDHDDMRALTEDCFQKCPIMVFKRQTECSAPDLLNLVSKFDPDCDIDALSSNQTVLHPFRSEPDAPHVAIREGNTKKKDLGDQFRFGPVWHMDLVGSKATTVPNVVSAFHFLQVPKVGGNTVFANLDIAYASFPPDTRQLVDSLQCVFDNDLNSLFNFRLDADGFTRLGPFPEGEESKDQVIRPLVQRDAVTGRKRFFFTPVRFNHFVGWDREASWEFMTYLFHTYINRPGNTASIEWEEGDIAIFNNHRLIHTSTPWELYKGEDRRFRLIFLNSKKMYSGSNPTSISGSVARGSSSASTGNFVARGKAETNDIHQAVDPAPG